MRVDRDLCGVLQAALQQPCWDCPECGKLNLMESRPGHSLLHKASTEPSAWPYIFDDLGDGGSEGTSQPCPRFQENAKCQICGFGINPKALGLSKDPELQA